MNEENQELLQFEVLIITKLLFHVDYMALKLCSIIL